MTLGMSRREFIRLTSVAALAASVPACVGRDEGSTEIEVAIAHLSAIIASAPFHVAERLGYYEERGLTVDHVSFPGGSDTIRGLRSGLGIGMPATVATLVAYAEGATDLRIVSGLYNAPQVLFLVPADSPVEGPEDLEGHTIAVSRPNSITNYFAQELLREQQFAEDIDVTLANVGGPSEAWTAVQSGIADVAWSAPPLSNTLIEDGEARLLLHAREMAPVWTDNVLVATKDFLEESGDAASRWVAAVGQAVDLIREEPETAAVEWAAALEIDEGAALSALVDAGDAWTTEISREGLEANVAAAMAMGQLTEGPDLDAIVAPDLLSST